MADDVTVLSPSTESPAQEASGQPSVQVIESAGRNDSTAPDSQPGSPSAEIATDEDGNTKPLAPMQKRRRVTRACDECRRKKIKCDGKQPCTHCTVYSYGELESYNGMDARHKVADFLLQNVLTINLPTEGEIRRHNTLKLWSSGYRKPSQFYVPSFLESTSMIPNSMRGAWNS